MIDKINQYLSLLKNTADSANWNNVARLGEALVEARNNGKQLFICGNGGSAGNAIHLANDFLYGVAPNGNALKVEALSANSAVLTCLGNDLGYEHIFSHQLKVKGGAGDILLVLSGSGNSPNIIAVLDQAKSKGITSFAVLGYSGGRAKEMADVPIHFEVDDMQIAEDFQIIVGHMLMQYMQEEFSKDEK